MNPGYGFSLDALAGEYGQRTVQWHVEEMDDNWIMPFYFLQFLQDNNLPGKLLFRNVDTADKEQEHEMIIGDLSTPDDSWAIRLTCNVYEDERGIPSNPTGVLEILESARQINQCIHDRGVRVMSDAAYEIIRLVRDATGGERAKLDHLRDALTEAGGDEVLGIWKTEAQAQQLREATKPRKSANSKRPGRL